MVRVVMEDSDSVRQRKRSLPGRGAVGSMSLKMRVVRVLGTGKVMVRAREVELVGWLGVPCENCG